MEPRGAAPGSHRMSGPLSFKEEAARCRRLARSMTDQHTICELTKLAEAYEAKALAEDRQAGLREPLAVQPIDGEVVVNGPARLAGSLAPDAAIETGERLIEAGHESLGPSGDRSDADPAS